MRKAILVLVMSIVPFAAHAEWVGGIGYYNLSDDQGSLDINLGAIAGSIGFRFDSESNFSVMPELRLGIGINKDNLFGANIEIETLSAFSVRGLYDFESGVYVFVAPSYARLDLKASSGGFSGSADDTEFGIGGGIGFHFSDTVMGELSYESYDDTDVIGGSFRFSFQ